MLPNLHFCKFVELFQNVLDYLAIQDKIVKYNP